MRKIIFLLFFLLGGCSSTPTNQVPLETVLASPLRVRRPPGPGASPYVGPGGVDYQSDPLPNERYDCKNFDFLFQKMDLASIQKCLKSIDKTKKVFYTLMKGPEPVLRLNYDEEETPQCLKRVFEEIPVPREIFFQAWSASEVDEGRELLCYNSRLNIEQGEFLGMGFMSKGYALRLEFPLEKIPQKKEEFQRMLLGWALSPFYWEEGRGFFLSKVVTQRYCRLCFGEESVLDRVNRSYPTWPDAQEELIHDPD